MIDIKLLRENPEAVRASQRARGEDEGVVDAVLEAEQRRRSSLTAFEQLRAEQKGLGKDVARAQGEEKQALLARTKELSQQVKDLQAAADEAQ
ncbi:MAG: serine--tRNA ligase, partial [Intrasporangiaceae bacterium]|nr:serine--tRNA ligase [Intrasporangiaceae bacterium]